MSPFILFSHSHSSITYSQVLPKALQTCFTLKQLNKTKIKDRNHSNRITAFHNTSKFIHFHKLFTTITQDTSNHTSLFLTAGEKKKGIAIELEALVEASPFTIPADPYTQGGPVSP